MRIVPQGPAARKNANSEFGIRAHEPTRKAEAHHANGFLDHQKPGGVISK
jgi:hypothetical protein